MSRSSSPQTSMTLSVSREDAHRMLGASHALNKRIVTLQQERDDSSSIKPSDTKEEATDATVPKRVVSTSETGSLASEEEAKVEGSIHQMVVDAASSCGDPLVQSFLASLANVPNHEIRVSLLLFLDMGKSTKLMKAFRTLSLAIYKKAESSDASGIDANTLTLKTDGATSLFRCFLTSILLCIHQGTKKDGSNNDSCTDNVEQPRKALKQSEQSSPSSSSKREEESKTDGDPELPCASPSFDSGMDGSERGIELSEETQKEIMEVATFASERLLDFVRKQKQDETASEITFEEFGSWYNAGGCSLVPWLELLDLSKWEAAGVLSTLATEEKRKEEAQSTNPQGNPQAAPSPTALPDQSESSTVNLFVSGSNDKNATQYQSRPIVSFDFTGAMSSAGGTTKNHPPFCIDISEENLHMFQNLVYRTGIASRSSQEVSDVLLRHSISTTAGNRQILVLHRNQFASCIRELVRPEAYKKFSKAEMEDFSTYFTDFFICLENGPDGLGNDQVNVKELAVAFSFLCAGNKSAKLAAGFELLDEEGSGQMSMQRLTQYIRSYLAMLVGISLLSATPGENKPLPKEKREAMNTAVDNGARWTLSHVQRHFEEAGEPNKATITFEDFANWYTAGGYKVSPWLELLDLSKLMALLGDCDPASVPPPPSTTNRLRQTTRSAAKVSSSDVLFTFPLANRRSLVVLREDATYVRSVVEKLALLKLSPGELWSDLYKSCKGRPCLKPVGKRKSGCGKSRDVDQATFVSCMAGVMESISTSGRKRTAAKISPEARDTLMNFFHSFDLEQVDRVALNELMGGLCLLCGGKKSTKLAFAFGLFDGRNSAKKTLKGETNHSLKGEELFLFLRSFLIVMFSCCQQSMDLSAEQVGQYISDTAQSVTTDVMNYQWNTRKKVRVDFDEFGEWYNEGGFETAPWLELLDLAKWVLADDLDAIQSQTAPRAVMSASSQGRLKTLDRASAPWAQHGSDCPPPPPEDSLDASFFVDDGHPLMQMDSLDEMDIMLLQQPSQDKENESFTGNNRVAMQISPRQPNARPPSNSLKFHLVTYEEHGGYMLSVSQRRVSHLRHILMESGLYQVAAEEASRAITSRATPSKPNKNSRSNANNGDLILTKEAFDDAMRHVISLGRGKANMSIETQRVLMDLLAWVFTSFDRSRSGKANGLEVACGLMVLCAGKKSDKLEHGFEVLDKSRSGKLSRREMSIYLKSFLAVLLSVASAPCLDYDANEDTIGFMKGGGCDRNPSTITRAADRGSDWATGQAFDAAFKAGDQSDTMSFDSFAEWYTSVGYTSIPWLELLDLRKWVIT